jgi:hypothetical protein
VENRSTGVALVATPLLLDRCLGQPGQGVLITPVGCGDVPKLVQKLVAKPLDKIDNICYY